MCMWPLLVNVRHWYMCVKTRWKTGVATVSCKSVNLLVRSKKKVLCRGLVFFMGREVPGEQLLLVIRSFGGQVGWDGEESPLKEDDPSITHQVSPAPRIVFKSSRQPQGWKNPSLLYSCIIAWTAPGVGNYGSPSKLTMTIDERRFRGLACVAESYRSLGNNNVCLAARVHWLLADLGI